MNRITRWLLALVLVLCLMWGGAPASAQIVSPLLGPSVSLSGQTVAIATTTLYTAGTTLTQGPGSLGSLNLGGGTFRVHTAVILTTAGGTVTTTATLGTEADNVFTCTIGGTNTLQYSTTFTGVTGTPAYTLRIRTEWLP